MRLERSRPDLDERAETYRPRPRDTLPRTAALKWFAGAYLLILGMSFLILPRGPIQPLHGLIWLRGPFFVLSGLALLWLSSLRLSRRAALVSYVLVAVPALAVAGQYFHLQQYGPAITLLLLGCAVAASPLAPRSASPAVWRPDALAIVLGPALAAQGIELLVRSEPEVVPYGVQFEIGLLFVVFGVALAFSHLVRRTPSLLRVAAHLGAGASLLALWVLLAVGIASTLWLLNVATVLLAAAILVLPWLSRPLGSMLLETIQLRLALGLFTSALLPVVIAIPIVLAHPALEGEVPTATREAAFGIAVLLSLAAAFGGRWLARRLTVPLSRLVRGVGDLTAGVRPVRLASGGPVEVEGLARAVQTMSDHLDDQRRQVERARDQHRAVAEKLQRALRATPETLQEVEVGHVYQSSSELAELGGDFFDAFPISGNRVGILIGDVSGKGLDAAAQAVLIRASLRAFAYQAGSPAEALAYANRLLIDSGARGFVTAFFGILDPRSQGLLCSSAGHPPPILLGSGDVTFLPIAGPVLGVFADARFSDSTFELQPGSVLLLYTDGLTEARREGEFFGEGRLLDEVLSMSGLSPMELAQRLYRRARAFAGGSLSDDIALIAVRLR